MRKLFAGLIAFLLVLGPCRSVFAATELDYMEYPTNAAAQAEYVSNGSLVYRADQCSGGSALVSSENGIYVKERAFDDNESTGWRAATTTNEYIGYDFGTGVTKEIRRIRIKIGGTAYYCTGSEKVDYSDNGTDWSLAENVTVADTVDWQNIDIGAHGEHRYWRLFSSSNANEWYLLKVEMMTTTLSLQSYSGSVYTQGSHSLEGIAAATDSLNKTLTRIVNPPINLAGKTRIKFDMMAGRIGSNIKISLVNNDHLWTERRPEGDVNKNWSIASDSDGSNLIAGINGGRLYTSSDYGANWTERRPKGDLDGIWLGMASDSDGSFLIAGESTGRLYTSSNGGVDWIERQPAGSGDKSWRHVASDSDGSNLIACTGEYTGRLYTSSDGGANWVERQPAGDVDKHWWGVASDSDGSNLIASVYNASAGGRLYTSANYGVTWTERRPAGDMNKSWLGVASDSDGTHLITCCKNAGRIYTSSNSGVDWTERRPAGDVDEWWYAVSSSSDGSHLVAGVNAGGRLYTSSDYGASWVEQRPSGDADRNWYRNAISSDGSRVIASSAPGRIYTSIATEAYTIEHKPNIASVDTFQEETIDISALSDAQKEAIGRYCSHDRRC